MSGPRIAIICVGKLKEKYFFDSASEYTKRLSRYARVEIMEIPDEPAGEKYSPAQIAQVKKREGGRILERIAQADFVVPLVIEGKSYSSEAFANAISLWSEGKRVVFVIGGSNGLCDEVCARGNASLSLSGMTFPHQMARVMLLEQIYRAFKIINGETYHK